MQKKFVVNLALLLFLNLLVKPFYILGIDAEVQNQVGAEDYGMYFSIFSFSNPRNDIHAFWRFFGVQRDILIAAYKLNAIISSSVFRVNFDAQLPAGGRVINILQLNSSGAVKPSAL